MLLGEKRVPGIPLPARLERRARFDVSDVKPTPEQLDFRLRLVVPITATPGPGPARSCFPWNHHDAPPSALDLVLDPILLVSGGLHRLDRQAHFIHQEVVTVEPMPGRLRPSPTRSRNWCWFACSANLCRQTQHAQTQGQVYPPSPLTPQFSFHWIGKSENKLSGSRTCRLPEIVTHSSEQPIGPELDRSDCFPSPNL